MPACNLRAAVAAHLRAEFGWLLVFECFCWLPTTLGNDKCSVWGSLQPWGCCKHTRSLIRQGCSSLGFWVPWFMQQETGAKQCWQFQLLPKKAEKIWWCSKIQNTGRMFKEPVLQWHGEDTLCRGTLQGLCHPEEKDHNSSASLKASVLMGWKLPWC